MVRFGYGDPNAQHAALLSQVFSSPETTQHQPVRAHWFLFDIGAGREAQKYPGRSAVWLARLHGVQEADSSNLSAPTIFFQSLKGCSITPELPDAH